MEECLHRSEKSCSSIYIRPPEKPSMKQESRIQTFADVQSVSTLLPQDTPPEISVRTKKGSLWAARTGSFTRQQGGGDRWVMMAPETRDHTCVRTNTWEEKDHWHQQDGKRKVTERSHCWNVSSSFICHLEIGRWVCWEIHRNQATRKSRIEIPWPTAVCEHSALPPPTLT